MNVFLCNTELHFLDLLIHITELKRLSLEGLKKIFAHRHCIFINLSFAYLSISLWNIYIFNIEIHWKILFLNIIH